MPTNLNETLTSFSGADLIVNFGPKTIGELQQISWGVKREKSPVFTLGSPDARSFSRGKRGIGGSLVMAQLNRDALMKEIVDDDTVWDAITPDAIYTAAGNVFKRGEDFQNALSLTDWNNASGTGITSGAGSASLPQQDGSMSAGTPVNVPQGFGVLRQNNIVYADQIPPFDVTLTFANEYGNAAFQKIYDLDILDESSGVSVDSIVMERAMSFVARRISPLMEGVYYRDSNGVMQDGIKASDPLPEEEAPAT